MLNGIKYIIVIISVYALSSVANAQPLTFSDEVDISLLTCSPGKEIWAQYGHTAIRYNDKLNGNDIAINYGLFSQDQPYFILRFIFGLTDYKVGAIPMDLFIEQYKYEGRQVTEQVLNLTKEEKYKIYKALNENLKPENTVYRYNFFYDNCTTRAENIILDNINRNTNISQLNSSTSNLPTFRNLIHRWNWVDKWDQLGEDILLGVKADKPVENIKYTRFLPENLKNYFAKIKRNNKQPLVIKTNQLTAKIFNKESIDKSFLSPIATSIILFVIGITLTTLQIRYRKLIPLWQNFIIVVTAAIGILLTAMIFSQHPCVNINFIICFFNPLPLIILFNKIKQKKSIVIYKIWIILIVMGLIGNYFQQIPVFINLMALFLLYNAVVNIKLSKN